MSLHTGYTIPLHTGYTIPLQTIPTIPTRPTTQAHFRKARREQYDFNMKNDLEMVGKKWWSDGGGVFKKTFQR